MGHQMSFETRTRPTYRFEHAESKSNRGGSGSPELAEKKEKEIRGKERKTEEGRRRERNKDEGRQRKKHKKKKKKKKKRGNGVT